MQVTRQHVFTVGMYVVLIVFMWLKSVQHTMTVRYDSLRHNTNNLHQSIDNCTNGLRVQLNAMDSHGIDSLKRMIDSIKKDPKNLGLAQDLLVYLQSNWHELKGLFRQPAVVQALYDRVQVNTVIYNAHAQYFNHQLTKFPSSLFAQGYSAVPLFQHPSLKGRIVER